MENSIQTHIDHFTASVDPSRVGSFSRSFSSLRRFKTPRGGLPYETEGDARRLA